MVERSSPKPKEGVSDFHAALSRNEIGEKANIWVLKEQLLNNQKQNQIYYIVNTVNLTKIYINNLKHRLIMHKISYVHNLENKIFSSTNTLPKLNVTDSFSVINYPHVTFIT